MKIVTASGLERELTNISGKHLIGFKDGTLTRYLDPETVDDAEKRILEYRQSAQILIAHHSGYLHAYDRNALVNLLGKPMDELVVGFVKQRFNFSRDNINWMFTRAGRLKKEGVPPIFLRDFETGTTDGADPHKMGFESFKYPTLDAIINVFVRDFVPKANRRINKEVDTTDIQFFRDYAIREEFSNQVREEITQSIEEKYDGRFQSDETKKYVLGMVFAGFEHLRRSLASMPSTAKLKVYDFKEDPEKIMSQPFWYTQFGDGSVDLIVRDYVGRLNTRFIGSEEIDSERFVRENTLASRILGQFPGVKIDFAEQNKQKLAYVRDRLRSGLTNYALKNFGVACQVAGISNSEEARNLVAPIVDELHVEKVREFSDSQLVDYINSLPEKACVATQPKTFEYLAERIYDLIGETSGRPGKSFIGRVRTLRIDAQKKNFVSVLYKQQDAKIHPKSERTYMFRGRW